MLRKKNRVFKVIAILLSVSLMIPVAISDVAAVYAENTEEVKYGDIDESKEVNASDALLVLKHAAKIDLLSEDKLFVADVSADDSVDAQDALWILRYAAKIVDKFPVEDVVTTTEPVTTEDIQASETPEPIESSEPSTSATPDATGDPIPTGEVVEGIPAEIISLNGADYYENDDIYNFTASSLRSRAGIEIANPIAGNKDMVDDYGYLRDVSVEGKINVFDLTGSKIGWNRDKTSEKLPIPSDQYLSNPDIDKDLRAWYAANTEEVHYPVPDEKIGFSMSFWVKTSKERDNSALLVFANDTQTISLSVNGIVKYTDVDDEDNKFDAQLNTYMDNEWHYYTITFANDWVTLYIDGQECVYDIVDLDRNNISLFNDGFLTRYNTTISWTEADFENDWRGYIQNQRGEHELYETITSDEYTVFGNGRFRGVGNVGKLLLTFMSDESTKVYIGGADVAVAAPTSKFSLDPETRVAQIEYYLKELTAVEASAIYKASSRPDDSGIVEATPEPTQNPDFVPVEMKVADLHGAIENNGVYTFGENPTELTTVSHTDKYGTVLATEIPAAYGVEFENPFAGNTDIVQSIEEALIGQTKMPYDSVAAKNSTLKLEYGLYGDTYYGDVFKPIEELTEEEKNPETATVVTKFHRPVYTKGATVSFWYRPVADEDVPATETTEAVIDSRKQAPIFTMYGQQSGLFTMRADGTFVYFDMCSAEWKDYKIGYGQQYNGLFAVGDDSLVIYNDWNHYTITFANDWIQVYINGQELIYKFVSMSNANKTLGHRFNGGFATRYNPIGQVTEDPDPVRQYISKANGIATAATDTTTAVDNTYTSIRQSGIYTKPDGYNALVNKAELGYEFRLMMDALTSSNMKFYIGGCPTELALREKEGGYNEMWKNLNGIKEYADLRIKTSHNQTGSQFADVEFYAREFSASDVQYIYGNNDFITKPK